MSIASKKNTAKKRSSIADAIKAANLEEYLPSISTSDSNYVIPKKSEVKQDKNTSNNPPNTNNINNDSNTINSTDNKTNPNISSSSIIHISNTSFIENSHNKLSDENQIKLEKKNNNTNDNTNKLLPLANDQNNVYLSTVYSIFQNSIKQIEESNNEEFQNKTNKNNNVNAQGINPITDKSQEKTNHSTEKNKRKTRWEGSINLPIMQNTLVNNQSTNEISKNKNENTTIGKDYGYSMGKIHQINKTSGQIKNSYEYPNFPTQDLMNNNLLATRFQHQSMHSQNVTNSSISLKKHQQPPLPSELETVGSLLQKQQQNTCISSIQSTPIIQDQQPENVKDYITRSFAKCVNLKERNIIEKALMKIMATAKSKGEYYTRNWKEHPLPYLPREKAGLNNTSVSNIGQQNSNNTSGNLTYYFNLEQESNVSYNVNNANSMQNMELEKKQILDDISKNTKPTDLNQLLNKRTFKMFNAESKIQIGLNTKGKKIIKTGKQQQYIAIEKSFEEEQKKSLRKGRFQTEMDKNLKTSNQSQMNANQSPQSGDENASDDNEFESLSEKWRVIGTNTNIEKPYLRLTSEPDPATIRPEHILKKTHKMLLSKWKEGKAEYPYIAEQFRSMRQDLMVQHIRNNFTVKVYESNARISLECHDINYFNLCQSKLYELYKHGIPSKHKLEFMSYRLIYLVFGNMRQETNRLLQEFNIEDLEDENIQYALEVRESYELGNAKKVFNLYKKGLNMSQYIFDLFLNKLRIWALQILCKSHGEKLSIQYLQDLLAFNDESQCINFIEESDGILTEDKKTLMLKESFKIYINHPWLQRKILVL